MFDTYDLHAQTQERVLDIFFSVKYTINIFYIRALIHLMNDLYDIYFLY